MLTQIMKAFREADAPMDLNELSRSLGTDRSALEGMLETLIRQGKLKEVSIGSEECGHCNRKTSCLHLQTGSTGKIYELTGKTS